MAYLISMLINMLPGNPKKQKKWAKPEDFKLIWDKADVEKPKKQTVEQQKIAMRMFAAGFKNKNKNKK